MDSKVLMKRIIVYLIQMKIIIDFFALNANYKYWGKESLLSSSISTEKTTIVSFINNERNYSEKNNVLLFNLLYIINLMFQFE